MPQTAGEPDGLGLPASSRLCLAAGRRGAQGRPGAGAPAGAAPGSWGLGTTQGTSSKVAGAGSLGHLGKQGPRPRQRLPGELRATGRGRRTPQSTGCAGERRWFLFRTGIHSDRPAPGPGDTVQGTGRRADYRGQEFRVSGYMRSLRQNRENSLLGPKLKQLPIATPVLRWAALWLIWGGRGGIGSGHGEGGVASI